MEVRDGVAHSSTIPSVLGIPQLIEKIRMGRMVFLKKKKKKKKKKRKHPTPSLHLKCIQVLPFPKDRPS